MTITVSNCNIIYVHNIHINTFYVEIINSMKQQKYLRIQAEIEKYSFSC